MRDLVKELIASIVNDESTPQEAASVLMDALTSASVGGFIAGGFVDPTWRKKFKPVVVKNLKDLPAKGPFKWKAGNA